MTFPDEAVRNLLSGLVPVKLDVDLDGSALAKARFKEESGVPAFALVDAKGVVLWQASGSRPADTLAREIREALAAGPPPDAGAPEAVLYRECVRLLAEGRHAEALAATERYLAAHEKRADSVRLLRARARYGKDGVREAWLDERIAALIPVFDHPWPGDTIAGRLKRALGGDVDEAASKRWVKEQNDTGDALAAIGEPAVDPLLDAMRKGSPRVAERCGWVLGRIRSRRGRDALLTMARDATLPAKTRYAIATAMSVHNDAAFLDPLAAWIRDRKQTRQVRVEAADALRGTLRGRTGTDARTDTDTGAGGTHTDAGPHTDTDALRWAGFLLDCLEDRDPRLRGELLQALLDIKAPYDLGKLAPLLEDERVAYLDVRVCDVACWCVLEITGKRVEGAEETTPEVVRLVATWLDRTRATLAWDAEQRRYAEPVAGR